MSNLGSEDQLINHNLAKVEELPLYPDISFISSMINSIDENNSIYKKPIIDKNKENPKKHRNEKIEYSLDEFSSALKYMENIIVKGDISINKINDLRRLNIEFRIDELNNKKEILESISNIQTKIDKIKNEEDISLLSDEDKLVLELQYKMQINYSILRYHKTNNLLQESYEESLYEFITKNNIIKNDILSIKSYIPKENGIFQNYNLIRKLIYENLLSIYICFKFLNYFKKDFENEKKLFLDMFMDLLKYDSENKNNNEIYIINEHILIMLLMNINQNFDDIKILVPYLKEGLFNKIISLKFNKNDANINFNENKFKYFVTINECFKQFVIKIFTEEKMFQNLIEGVIKYAWANVKNENNEIYVEDFLDLCSEYAKDNEELFEKALLNVFDIVEIENNKNRTVEKDKDKDKLNSTKKVKYAFRLKPIFEKCIQNIKNELKYTENKEKEKEKEKNKEKDKDKDKDKAKDKEKDKDKEKEKDNENDAKIDDSKNMDIVKENEKQIENDLSKQMSLSQCQSKKKKNALQTPIRPKSKEEPKTQQINSVKKKIEEQMEQISQLFSDTNKSIFHHLLKHIWATTCKVEKDIEKSEPNKIFSRNYIIDLDTSLIALTKILYCFPSYLSLVNRFYNGKKHKTSFFNFIIRNIIPVLNYYHYHVILPAHVNNNEELIDIISREKNDTLRKYGNRANSYMSFMESFRYMNIITSLVQSMTYKKRNMNDDENLLLNKCRKKILFELNSSLAEITKKIKDFNSLHNNPHTALKSVILFKSNIIVLFSMTEFHEDSHIYSQYNPFEISNLVFSKEYEIIKNISIILKNMKINNKNEIYHEMGIKYLGNLFKFIRINSKIKIKNKTNDINNDSEHEIEGEDGDIDINGNSNENEENEEDEDDEGNEDEEMLCESDSFSNAEDEGDDSDLENDNFIEEDDDDEEDEDNEEDEENNEENDYIDEDDDNEFYDIREQNNEDDNNDNDNNNNNNNNNDENNDNNNENNNQRGEEIRNRASGLSASNYFEQNENENENENDNENENENENEEEDVDVEFEDLEDEENDNDDDNEGDFEVSLFLGGNNGNNNNDMNRMEIIENNDSHSDSHINNYHRNISGFRFNINYLRRRNNDIESVCNHRENNDDYALFYNPFLETMNNGQNSVKSEMELYFEESACFPFNIYKYKENNSLILFYKPNIGIKLINKKNIDIVEKMTNIFLYNYIFPFDISYKRYFNFALIGAKEKTMNYYSKEIEKIKDNYFSVCYISDGWDRKVKREKNNILKEIKKYILENGNIIKLEVSKEEKQIEDNKDKDKVDEKKDNDKNNKMIDFLYKGPEENNFPFSNMDIEPNLSMSELSIFNKTYSPLQKKDEKNDKEKEDKKEEKEKNEQKVENEIIEEKKEEDKANENEAKNENENENNMQIEENEDNNNKNNNNNESKDNEENNTNNKIEEDKNVNENKNEVIKNDSNNKEENDDNNKEDKNDNNNNNENKNDDNNNENNNDINNNENKNDDNNNEKNNDINNNENKNDENNNVQNNTENKNENNNNENNNQNIDNQFIVELPPDLREEILLNLDPTMVPNLSPDLQQEYHRLVNRNNLMLLDFPNLQGSSELNIFPLNMRDLFPDLYNNRKIDFSEDRDEIRYNKLLLKKFRYNKEDILSNSKHNKEYSSIILQIFDDDFIENLFVYNIKTIITYKQKYQNININAYFQLLNELIMNVHLRHKILDLIFMLWICDSARIKNVSKDDREKNSLIKNLYYLYIEMDLTEDYYFDDYDQFFQNFSGNYQKEMKKYFLQTANNEKGGYISLKNKKEYSITNNSKNLKKVLEITYDKNENVLSNLLSLIMLESKSDIKKIFSIKIFTNIIQNCFKTPKDEINQNKDNKDNKDNNNKEANNKNNNNNNNILHISCATIEKIIDLFNNFEISLDLQKGTKSNNPTSLLNELMLDNNVYQLLLEVLLKRITQLKTGITNEMDTFFNNNKLDITLFSKPLPEIILFKLIKFINNINNNINKKYYTKSNNLSPTKEEQEIIDKNSKIKKELLAQYKVFIGKISDILFSCWEQLNKLLYDINIMLKDDQKTIASKLNRLIPYLESFITLSHLHFIFYGNNSSTSVASKFVIEANYKAEQKSPSRNNLLSFNDSSFIKFFYNFCEKNKKVINIILRRYPKKFPNELIIKISSILDLENKKKYFKQELRKLPFKNEYLRLKVRRNGSELFTDSFGSLSHKKPEQWRSKFMVTFEGEEAVDAGGVRREWLTILAKEMFNPNYMLFTLAKNGTTYTINSDSGKYNPEHLKHFEFVGKIMAKAIFDGMMLDCYFTRIIYKLITNTPLSYHDMEDYDPVFYNSLKWLLDNDFTDSDTYLTYSYNHDNLGDMQIVDLIENGRNIDVTEKNKFDYVQKLCSSKLYETIKPQVEALLKGFYEIIPQKLISIFNYRELELVISGLPTIDIKDWKNNTEYENYNTESPVIKNFWEIIESFDNDERAEFLQFVTGCSKVPLEGFSALQGIGGVNKFKISKVFEKDFERLPTAHTCTNQLDLPEYPNKEILYERLTFAIKEGKGFGFV